MQYSIVMPVFNREDLTLACLATLPPTLEGAGDGEIIVVDNGSRPATMAVLERFPQIRILRNERNLGFAAACNAGARVARGEFVCHLNNDIIAQPGWLARMVERLTPDVGIVGARLFFPNDTLQHAGVAMYPVRFGPEGIGPHHIYWGWSRDTAVTAEPADYQIVTGACLLTPRKLFLDLGGFDEIFWNGYEDVDYCLRVRERGLRVVYEPRATLYHYESQSGVQRKRRVTHNLRTLGKRHGMRVDPDHNRFWARGGSIRRQSFSDNIRGASGVALPPTTVVIHGPPVADRAAFLTAVGANRIAPHDVVWLPDDALASLGPLLEGRADRYFAFVHTATELRPGWLDELVNTVEYGVEVFAATVVPPDESAAPVEPCAADARCTLLALRNLPHHVRFGAVQTVDAALVDLTLQGVGLGLGVRAMRAQIATLAPPVEDPMFLARHEHGHDALRRADPLRLEAACATPPAAVPFASIVMLSWNAAEYTRMAVESIRRHTRTPYEIIIVDNGSRPETIAVLQALDEITIVFNATNRGFAYGCNQGIAAARGTHVVLLNNDVIVTDGWLENLLAVHARDPLVGVSAPRSNRIAGHQQLPVALYDSPDEMQTFAAVRAREYQGEHYRTNRAIGFCLCIARAVIEEVGGIDTRYGVGNFEDDDFCIRVRAAGYQIAVCEDSFIHHFGSISFTANGVDYGDQLARNWRIFAERWDLPTAYPSAGYNALPAIARGFERSRDYVALPAAAAPQMNSAQREYQTAFVAFVDSEASWSKLGPLVSNYLKALAADDSALFSIGVFGSLDAVTVGARISRSIARLHLDEAQIADIEVVDVPDVPQWLRAVPGDALRMNDDDRLGAFAPARDRSPSGLARTVRGKRT